MGQRINLKKNRRIHIRRSILSQFLFVDYLTLSVAAESVAALST